MSKRRSNTKNNWRYYSNWIWRTRRSCGAIFGWGFYGQNLNSIVLPDTITALENNTFQNSGLKNITIPESVTRIGDGNVGGGIFSSLTLDYIAVPESVDYFGYSAFSNTSLNTIVIPGASEIDDAFSNSSIENVILMEGVTTISKNAFYGNTALTSIEIPSSVTTISADVANDAAPFRGNTNLTEIVVRNASKPSGFNVNWNCKTFGAGNTPSGRQCTETFNTIYRK